jgi:NTP pyrophosphatase (non-canonical NTP hydrolase)
MFENQTKNFILFVKEREWNYFHSPKNLAMALFVETSELLEIFLEEPNDKEKIKEELGDICNCLLALRTTLHLSIPAPSSIHLETDKISNMQSIVIKLVVDTGRFVEHFQWITIEESNQLYFDKKMLIPIQKAFEKIWLDLFRISRLTQLNLELCAKEKLEKTAIKYPASLVKGTSTTYYKLKKYD